VKKSNKKFQNEVVSYLEFKLNKELNYEDTFGKDEKIQEEYKIYVEKIQKEKS